MQSDERERVVDPARSAAFAAFYRRHYAAVFGFTVRRMDDRETAREVALDVFRIAWDRFGVEADPDRAWLIRVARNRIGDAYRHRDRERRLVESLGTEPGGTASTDAEVRDVLGGLPSATRELLMLRYWDGLSAAEIGELLDCTPAAVWVRMHRARRAFAAAWAGNEGVREAQS